METVTTDLGIILMYDIST